MVIGFVTSFEDNKYLIVKLVKKNISIPLTYEQSLVQVKADYEKSAKNKKLEETAISELKDFKGTDIVAITRESITKITGLEQQEAAKFLNQLFSSTTKEGIVKLDNKVVLYKINNSKMAEYNKAKDEVVKSAIIQLQEDELMTNLLKRLGNTFVIHSSIQEKEK
mgnify:FL=1